MNKLFRFAILGLALIIGSTCYAADYNLWIAGVRVTSNNASNITGTGISGSVSYNPSQNILTLNGATINNSDGDGIQTSIDGLKIQLIGDNTINADDDGVQITTASTTFTGQGYLTINSAYGLYSYSCSNKTLAFADGCHVTVDATSNGITFNDGTLEVNCSDLSVKGNSMAVQCGSLNLSMAYLSSPAGAYYNSENQTICYQNSTNGVSGNDVVIFTSKKLKVQGVLVTSLNADDVLGDGTVSYDETENTLTLNGASIVDNGLKGIDNGIENLKIVLVGNNTITSTNSGLHSTKDFTIEGRGSLDVTGTDGIYASSCDLTIQGGCEVTATGTNNSTSYSGIYGGSSYTFNIINSIVTAKKQAPSVGSVQGYPISGFEPQCSGCWLTSPSGATWSNGHYVVDGIAVTSDPVVISPDLHNLWVAGTHVTSVNESDILGDGKVSYNPNTNVLTLNGATIVNNNDGIFNGIEDLVISLEGYNTINANGIGINSEGNLTIEGRGRLVTTGMDGIYVNYRNLTIQGGCDVMAIGTENDVYHAGIRGAIGKFFTVTNSSVVAEKNVSGTVQGYPIEGFEPQCTGCRITSPTGIVWSGGTHSYVYVGNENPVTTPITILPYDYNVYVQGIQITSGNADDVLNDGGKVTYNAATNVLTLNGASIVDNGLKGIDNGIEDLKIVLVGNNTITSTNSGIHSTADFTIEGRGRLNVTGSDGIYAEGCDLTIQGGCEIVTAATGTSSYSGIYGNDGKTLTIARSKVTATTASTTMSAIHGFSTLTLDGTSITTPENGVYQNGDIYINNLMYRAQVVISPDTYDLWIADTQVNAANAPDVFGDGKVSYNANNKMLVLNNAEIEGGDSYGIDSYIDDLKIVLQGANTVTSDYAGIHSTADFTILGSDYLTVTAPTAIYADDCNMTIRGGCTVVANGTGNSLDAGIMGATDYNLTISCSAVEVTSASEDNSPICGFTSLLLNRVYIYSPTDGDYHDEMLYDGDEVFFGTAVIMPETYNLWVAGHHVSSANAPDVLDDGTVSYDADTKVLTLNDAEINHDGNYGIYADIADLKIVLQGANAVASNNCGIYSAGDFTIEGSGTIVSSCAIPIYASNCNLTISGGCVVTAGGTLFGVYGAEEGDDYTLTIRNSWLTASSTSTEYSAIHGFSTLTLDGVVMHVPQNGVYHDKNMYVNDLLYRGENGAIAIQPIAYDLWVAGTQVNTSIADDIMDDGGTVSYNPNTNELTLNGAFIDTEHNFGGIKNEIADLAIVLVGENEISSSYSGIRSSQDFVIKGRGELDVSGSDGILAYYCDLTIQDGCTVHATGNKSDNYAGIYGFEDYDLTINGSKVTASAADDGEVSSIYGFSNLSIVGGVRMTSPANGSYSNRMVVDEGGALYLGQVVIEPKDYDLTVGGIKVNSAIVNDVLYDGGTVRYDTIANVLTLNGTNINVTNKSGLHNGIPNLRIALVGNNYITANAPHPGISSNEDFVIEGNGRLEVLGTDGILANHCNLTIQGGCTVYATSTATENLSYYSGIYGYSDYTFNIINSTVIAQKQDYGIVPLEGYPISGFQPNCTGCSVTEPAGATWSNGHYVDANLQDIHDMIVITPSLYGIVVDGVNITTANASDVFGDGTVIYDPVYRRLALNGVNFSYEGDGIYSIVEGLTIEINGENTVNSTAEVGIGAAGIKLCGETTFCGTGTLHVTGEYGIYCNVDELNPLLISIGGGCKVIIDAIRVGFYYGEGQHSLSINASTLHVRGANYGSLMGGFLDLNHSEITYPSNVAMGIDQNGQSGIVDGNENLVRGWVYITPFNRFLGTVNADWSNSDNWRRGELPGENDRAYIDAYCNVIGNVRVNNVVIGSNGNLMVQTNSILEANDVSVPANTRFTINGGQFIGHSSGIMGRAAVSVPSWSTDPVTGWSLISSPIVGNDAQELQDFITAYGDYDLFRYNETNHSNQEWQNYKSQADFTAFEPGRGYLFADEHGNPRFFNGVFNYEDVEYTLTYTESQGSYPLTGFNLIGNPFTHNIYKGAGAAIDNSHLAVGYYVLDENGAWTVQSDNVPIKPCQAILVRTNATTTLTIANTTAAPSAKGIAKRSIGVSVSGNGMNDKAILNEGEGRGLTKIAHTNAKAPMLYVAENGTDYAIVEKTNLEGEYVLCFKAGEIGTYTIMVETFHGTSLREMVLRDTLTGVTVNLGAEGYTFLASPDDTAERFVLVVK